MLNNVTRKYSSEKKKLTPTNSITSRLRVQHWFGGMRDESKNRGGMWGDRYFYGGILDKNTAGEAKFSSLRGGMRDSFKIDGGMRDEKQKIAR